MVYPLGSNADIIGLSVSVPVSEFFFLRLFRAAAVFN